MLIAIGILVTAAAAQSPTPPSDAPPATPHVTMITNPTITRIPSANDLASIYPPWAQEKGRGGAARIQCTVSAQGTAENCHVLSETPQGYGFGQAALKAAKYFRFTPELVDGQPTGGAKIMLPLNFGLVR